MESRRTPRVPIPPQVTGEVTVYQPMSILDLSIAGAQIETPVPLLHDSIHDFRLTLEDGSVIVGIYATGNSTASVMGRC